MTWLQFFQEYSFFGAFWGLSIALFLSGFSKLVTLGRLERKIATGDRRLTQVEMRLVEKIEAVNQRLTERITHLDERFSTWVTQFDKRMERIETTLDQLLER